MTAVSIPAPLVRAFRAELTAAAKGGPRRRFLDRVAVSAAGPAPEAGSAEQPADVALEDGVALAVAVVDHVAAGRSDDVPATAPLALPGRAAARELAVRLRRRALRAGRRR